MIISKNELKKALEIVKPGLANKEIIEQSTHFAFFNGCVVTFNDEISVSHPISNLDFEGAVNSNELYQFLNKIKTEEVELNYTDDQLIIKSGRSKAGLVIEEVTLPTEEIGKFGSIEKLPDDFCEGLEFALMACSNDNSRPILTCINVYKDFIESSDSARIIRYRMDSALTTNCFLIPGHSVRELIKLNPTKVAEGKGWVHFQANKTTISCRIFEDSFPDVRKFLKVEGINITMPKVAVSLIERAMIFSKKDSGEDLIKITIKKGKLIINSRSEKGSWFRGSSKIDYDGNTINFSVNPNSLKDILNEKNNLIIGDKTIRFESNKWIYVSVIIK